MAIHGYELQLRKIAWKLDRINSKLTGVLLKVKDLEIQLNETKKEFQEQIKEEEKK